MIKLFEKLDNFTNFKRIFVGFSGGLDSTVLIHLLHANKELRPKINAIHINHGLSEQASSWAQHCQQVCKTLTIPLLIENVIIDATNNVEERARDARYQIFTSLLESNDCLLLAHHKDDQAETVLLRLFRGSGVSGLGAMEPIKNLGKGKLIRPLLDFRRDELLAFAQQKKLCWIIDATNQSVNFDRNFIRHKVMPTIESRWPAAVNNIVRASHHCQQAHKDLKELALIDISINEMLSIAALRNLSISRIKNVLRLWLEEHQVRMPANVVLQRIIDEIIYARIDANPEVVFADVSIKRHSDNLVLLKSFKQDINKGGAWVDFPKPYQLNQGVNLIAVAQTKGVYIPHSARIDIRYRVGGEKIIYKGQTKSLKKLLQEWLVPTWERAIIPLLYIDDELAVVVGFAVGDKFYEEGIRDIYHVKIRT